MAATGSAAESNQRADAVTGPEEGPPIITIAHWLEMDADIDFEIDPIGLDIRPTHYVRAMTP